MKAVSKMLAAGVGFAALASAAPAAAQYYPGYGGGYGGAGALGAIIEAILGTQRYGQGYGYSRERERYLIEQCARVTESRLQRSYGGYNSAYGGYNSGYGGAGGYNGYGGYGTQSHNYAQPARIVAITSVQRRSSGGLKIYGTATSGQVNAYGGGAYGGGYGGYGGVSGGYGGYGGYGGVSSGYGGYSPYGGGYNQAAAADLRFDCTVDYRGRVVDVDVERNRYGYGY